MKQIEFNYGQLRGVGSAVASLEGHTGEVGSEKPGSTLTAIQRTSLALTSELSRFAPSDLWPYSKYVASDCKKLTWPSTGLSLKQYIH